jgi:hypothetical protein
MHRLIHTAIRVASKSILAIIGNDLIGYGSMTFYLNPRAEDVFLNAVA